MSLFRIISLVVLLLSLGHCTDQSRFLETTSTVKGSLKVKAADSVNITDENGNLIPPFTLPKGVIGEKIQAKSSEGVFLLDEEVNYFTLQFFPSIKLSHKIKVESENGLAVRLDTFSTRLYKDIAVDFNGAVATSFYRDKSTTTNAYVQFLCKDNNSHPVTFSYAITNDPDYSFNTSDTKSFVFIKKCRVGKHNVFSIRLANGTDTPHEKNIFSLSELTNASNSKEKLVFYEPGPNLTIFTNTEANQPIVNPKLTPLNAQELEVELKGDTAGALVSQNNSTLLVLFIHCKVPPKEHLKENLIPFEFSFYAPPYEEIKAIMYADCNKIQNFERSHPLTIGTGVGLTDVIYKGDARGPFHIKGDKYTNHLKRILPEVGATEFFIYSDFSGVSSKENYTTEVVFDSIIISPASSAEIVDMPSSGNITIKETPRRFVLEYICTTSEDIVLTVTFKSQSRYKYDFNLIKICHFSEYNPITPSKYLHLGLIVVAVVFGIYLILTFKRLLVKEKSRQGPPHGINAYNFKGTQMRSRTIAPLDDSLESDTRGF